MPTVGFYDKVYNGFPFTPGTAGANQTWDFSGVTFNNSGLAKYEPCVSTNGCSNHAGANIAHVYLSLFTYYKASANTLSMQGFFNGGAAVYYSDPEDYMRFPMSYGKSFIDSFAASYTASTGTWYRKGFDTVSADAWGSLKTPAGTFPNTLRIKIISTYSDTGIIQGLPDRMRYKGITYYYYDIAHKDFLFATASFTITPKSGPQQTTSYSRYTINQSVDVTAPAIETIRCEIVPNPAREKIQVALILDAPALTSVSLLDITGRLVHRLPATVLNSGENRVTIPVEDFSPGVYTVRIMAGEAVMARKVVIE